MIRLSEFQASGSICEDLILFPFYLEILNKNDLSISLQREEIGRSVGMSFMGNRSQVAHMVAQWITFYATAALKLLEHSKVD